MCSGWSGPPRAVGQGRTTEGALHPSKNLLESPPLPLTPAPKKGRTGGAEPREGESRAGLVWGEEAGELAACSHLRGAIDSHPPRLQGQKAVTLCALGRLWLPPCVRPSKFADTSGRSTPFTSSGPLLPSRRLSALQLNPDPLHSQP